MSEFAYEAVIREQNKTIDRLESKIADLASNLETAEAECEAGRKRISRLESKIQAARGLIAPLGNQPIPSVLAIRAAIQILA